MGIDSSCARPPFSLQDVSNNQCSAKIRGKHLNNQGVSLLVIDVEYGKKILKKRCVTTD